MRGTDQQQNHMFSYLSPEMRVHRDHPLRAIRAIVEEEVLTQLSRRFDGYTPRLGVRRLRRRSCCGRQHAWKPSDQPAWLTDTFYSEKVQPVLSAISASAIARQISVSRWYAGRIREGYRPHPRHWQALAVLAGVSV